MSLFFTVLAATIVGQTLCLWVIGALAYRQQKKQSEKIEEAMKEYHGAMLREQQRMKEYAKMEG